jgi:hypothetical protein
MAVRKFAVTDASFERSPGQDGDVFAANVIDQRDGAPISIGFGRYGPDQHLQEKIAVHGPSGGAGFEKKSSVVAKLRYFALIQVDTRLKKMYLS